MSQTIAVMSQTIAVCMTPRGLRVYNYARLPFCYCPAKIIHSPNQCVSMGASDLKCVVQGGAGPAECADSGKTDTITINLFCNGTPKKMLCRECL